MNYDHTYHAGGFSDVFKHLVLIALFEKLQKKDSALVYIDTHAAYPSTDLQSSPAQKTQEAQAGIRALRGKNVSSLIEKYLALVEKHNVNLNAKNRYPGSAAIAALLKRPQDRLILNELMDKPYEALAKFFRRVSGIHCHQQDAYQALKAFLPPKEKRGIVLIDPPYENPREFTDLLEHIPAAVKRWPQGTYAIWYPIKDITFTEQFVKKLARRIDVPLMNFVLEVLPSDVKQRLSGTGMIIINPPWQIAQVIKPLVEELQGIFTKEQT